MQEIEPIEIGRTPYNEEFCEFKECGHLRRHRCFVAECIYNHKRIIFWEKFGVWKEA